MARSRLATPDPSTVPPAPNAKAASRCLAVASSRDERDEKFGHLKSALLVSDGGSALIEKIKTLDTVMKNYTKHTQLFQDWLNVHGLAPNSARSLLLHCLDYPDEFFEQGCDHNDGSKVFAALKHICRPALQEPALLERIRAGLSGWAKRCPAGMRDPLAWEAVMAIVGYLI